MKKKILIVDDNGSYGLLLTKFLSYHGFLVRFESCPIKGLAAAADFIPDLALVDFNMPELNGDELIDHLLGIPALQQLRCLCITGNPEAAFKKIAAVAPGCRVLDKEISLENLLLEIKTLLNT